MNDTISSFFDDQQFGDPCFFKPPVSPDNLFSIFDALEGLTEGDEATRGTLLFQDMSEAELEAFEVEVESEERKSKKAKRDVDDEETKSVDHVGGDGYKVSHIAVERNRRKQMNEHLSVLRSLMPCFYVKRGDQASIIEGVVEYISELQQVLQSLEAKKQRKVYSEVLLSPRVVSSPRPSSTQVLSPRKPPLSPRLINLPISPRTPQPCTPYNNRPRNNLSPSVTTTPIELLSPTSSTSSLNDSLANELVASLKSPVADVEVKFSGSNLVLKTVSPRIPGQVLKIVSALEDLSLEILHISIGTVEDTMLNSFTIKIGIECELSAEELAHQIQQTFCSPLIY